MSKHKILLYLLLSFMLSFTTNTFAATGDISTIAGGGIKDNVPASESMVSGPWNMFIDPSDNIYIADWRGNYITKVDANGTFSIVAGNGLYKFDGDGLPPKEMSLRGPNSVAADSDGNVYFNFGGQLRKVDPSGNVSTVVSGGFSGRLFIDASNNIYYQTGSGINRIDAQTGHISTVIRGRISGPDDITMDTAGNLYIAAAWEHRVYKIDTSGGLSAFAGDGFIVQDVWNGRFAGDNGPARQASLDFPRGVAVDNAGNVYISDRSNFRIRKVDATTGNITTVVGTGTKGFSGDGGPATAAQIGDEIFSMAFDNANNLYLCDTYNNRIRKVDATTGIISTIAGGDSGGDSGDGGPASASKLNFPTSMYITSSGDIYIANFRTIRKIDAATNIISTVAGKANESGFSQDGSVASQSTLFFSLRRMVVDNAGNIYYATLDDHRIRKVDAATGTLITIAGNGTAGSSGDGGPATEAQINGPQGLSFDASGNLLICDQQNHRIRKVDLQTGTITTRMGADMLASEGESALNVRISSIQDLSVDPSGNVYVADQGADKIWKVDATTGLIHTLAGTGQGGYSGDGGPATSAQLNNPRGVYADGSGNVYIGDRSNHRIRKVDASGTITTIAGGNAAGERGTLRGNAIDGTPATEVQLGNPQGVSKNSNGEVHFTDRGNKRIFRIDSAGNMHTVAGTYLGDDGPATQAHIANPGQIFKTPNGNIYIADGTHHRVRKVDPSGTMTTIAGNGSNSVGGDGGAATLAGLSGPRGVFVDAANNVFIHDNARIRKVDASGMITTIAGNPEATNRGDGGLATQASIFGQSMFVDGAGNIFFAQGNSVRKIDTNGIITTIAGNNGNGFSGDGGPALNAQLNNVSDLFIDSSGNIFLSDTNNRRIRKIDATTGIITTVAGNGTRSSTGDDGPATDASLGDPSGLFVDGAGNIFVAERFEGQGNRIRKIDPSGTITTVAGNGSTHYSGDNTTATNTSLWIPTDVFVDTNGDLIISDSSNQRIRKVEGVGTPTTLNPGTYQGPTSPELVATQAGSNVEVALPDLGENAPAISLTFDNVASGGVTTVAPVESGPPPPEGLRLGQETVYYDFNTTASFSGPVDLCFNYTGMNVGNEAELKLFHYVNDVWTDVTSSLDTQNNIICGQATSFSFFALFVPLPLAPTPKHLAVVNATVTQAGVPIVGATVSFSRSVAGHSEAYLWQGTTDAEGKARIEILIEDILTIKGASGYYKARVASTSGTLLDTYHSVPITGQEEVNITLPIGEALIFGSTRLLDLSLSANVPNPFNPSTTIAYHMPESGNVSLTIYNALGQHVQTLVNTFQSAGQYHVSWDGTNTLGHAVSSGVYFYRLTNNAQVQTRRMLLLK